MNNLTKTENNAATYLTSLSPVLDLFFNIGAMRTQTPTEILDQFHKSYERDPEKTLKVVFYGRDARGGNGERKTIHTILARINEVCPPFLANNAAVLADLGYYKDLRSYIHNPGVAMYWATKIRAKDRLACKWAPRKGDAAKVLKDQLGLTWKEYRTHLKDHSATVEQLMSAKNFSKIVYPSVPGRASALYRKAFLRNDETRYNAFLDGKSKAAVSATYPHDVIWRILKWKDPYMGENNPSEEDVKLADKQWSSLTDYVKPGESILPMVDASGSMWGGPSFRASELGGGLTAGHVAFSLGVYLAERNKGKFKNRIMSFSGDPDLTKLEGDTLVEKLHGFKDINIGMNTALEKAYNSLLNYASSFDVPKSQMPTMLIILSDMQFDECVVEGRQDSIHLDNIKTSFSKAGYSMPKIVFWNLAARSGQTPALSADPNVALVGGFNPAILESVMACEDFNPLEVMNESISRIELNFDEIPDAKDLRS